MRKKIGILIPTLDPGGAESVAVALANGLSSRGHAVDLIVKRAGGRLQAPVNAGVNLMDTGAKRTLDLLLPLRAYLRAEKPDALISLLELTNITAILAKKLAGSAVNLICTTHSNIEAQESVLGPKAFERLALRWLYGSEIQRVVVSHAAASAYARYTGIPLDRIHVIYNPVIDAGFAERSAEPLAHPWLTSKQEPVFVFAGRLDPVKRVTDILQALALFNAIQPARLLVLGEGPERAAIEARVTSLNLGGRVELLGHVPNPLPYMRQADALVLASEREGFSMVLVEAMACGCPVISTDCPYGPAELLDEGRLGHLVPVGDSDAMTAAMQAVLAGDRRPATAKWLAQFSADQVLDQYQALL